MQALCIPQMGYFSWYRNRASKVGTLGTTRPQRAIKVMPGLPKVMDYD